MDRSLGNLQVVILALEYIPFTDRRYDGMGFINYIVPSKDNAKFLDPCKIHWKCSAYERQLQNKTGEIDVTLHVPHHLGLTDYQIKVLTNKTAQTIKSMACKGGPLHAGKVMQHHRKDLPGDEGFDRLPIQDEA